MTNQTTHPPHHQIFQELLRQHGITQMHGVELVRLIHKIANTYESITSERMRDDSLSEPRWRLLVRLWIAEQMGNPCVRPTQLSKTQQVSKNTISTHLRSLEEQGLIERELDPDDRRQFRIRLSGAGRALVEAATPGHVRFLNQLTAGLTASEVDELQRLLELLHQSLITYGQVEPPCHYPE